ncbi:MAG: hypothetical protein ACRD3A_12300 [Terriglobales bacterium]
MKRSIAVLISVVFLLNAMLWAGLGSDKTLYVGGTVKDLKDMTEGKSSAKDEKVFVFVYEGGRLEIPYDRVNSLEYGQKAGRRVGAAVLVSPYLLFSKKRKHFITINYLDDDDKQQAVVLELGKNIVRVTLASLEARTGRKVEYQDEESRNSGRGN